MNPVLLLGHAGLSLVLIIGGLIPRSNRVMLVKVVAGLGVVLGAALAVASGSTESWRTTLLDTEHAVLAGVTIACAWLLVAALDRDQGRWDVGALIGVGCTGIAMMGTTRWLVPGLLFSFIASLAVAAAVSSFQHRGEVWLQIFATAAMIVGAIFVDWQDGEFWGAPDGISGWSFWLLVAGIVVRAGAIPAFGMWRLCGCSAAAGAPLLVGSSFILLAGPGSRVEPWLTVGLLAASVVVVVWALILNARVKSPARGPCSSRWRSRSRRPARCSGPGSQPSSRSVRPLPGCTIATRGTRRAPWWSVSLR